MSKVFKVTQSNQYVQTVALSKGDYVFQCNVKHHKDALTIALKDGSNVWHEYEVPCKKNTWVDKAQLKFTTTVDMTAFSLCYKDASTQKPVYIEKPVLKMGTEIGVISPNYKDLIEELESSLVINNGEGSLLNGLLDITELTNDKGSANLSLDVGKSILRKNVSLVKNKEGKEGDKGDTGLAGQIPIQKEWVAGDTHRNNDEIVDYIYVRGQNKEQSYWYKAVATVVEAEAPPENGTTPTGYVKINWLKELAVNVLLAEEANVAGFIFKDNKLISEKGTLNGVPTSFGDNLTPSQREAFIPNLVLNGKEGNVDLTGNINATSGSFKGRVEAESGSFKGHIEATSGTITDATLTNITGTNARFTGAINTPFIENLVFHGYSVNSIFTNDNDFTTLELPTDVNANGMTVRIINKRNTSKTVRTPPNTVPVYNGDNSTNDNFRHDMPPHSYCEFIAFYSGEGNSLSGWIVKNKVTLTQ